MIIEVAAHPGLAGMTASVVQMPLVLRTFHVYTDADLQRSPATTANSSPRSARAILNGRRP